MKSRKRMAGLKEANLSEIFRPILMKGRKASSITVVSASSRDRFIASSRAIFLILKEKNETTDTKKKKNNTLIMLNFSQTRSQMTKAKIDKETSV